MNCSKTNWATSLRFTSSNATASWEIIWDRESLQRVLHTHSSRKAFSWGPMLRPPSCTRSLSPTPRKVPSWDHSSPFSLYATRRSSRSLRQSVEKMHWKTWPYKWRWNRITAWIKPSSYAYSTRGCPGHLVKTILLSGGLAKGLGERHGGGG